MRLDDQAPLIARLEARDHLLNALFIFRREETRSASAYFAPITLTAIKGRGLEREQDLGRGGQGDAHAKVLHRRANNQARISHLKAIREERATHSEGLPYRASASPRDELRGSALPKGDGLLLTAHAPHPQAPTRGLLLDLLKVKWAKGEAEWLIAFRGCEVGGALLTCEQQLRGHDQLNVHLRGAHLKLIDLYT